MPWAGVTALVAATLAGLGIMAGGGNLGVSTPPFVMAWRPNVNLGVLASLAVIAGALAVAPAIVSRGRPGASTATALYALSLAVGLGVNLGHEGVRGLAAMFSTGSHGTFEGHFEYLLGLPLLQHGVGYYLHNFAFLYPWMTTHIKGNPPGPLVAIHLLGIDRAPELAALAVGVGTLCAPLAYGIARELGDEQRGRIAGILTACSPSVVLFGVSSLDYAFAGLGMLAAWLLVHGGRGWLATGAAVAALGTFFSWLLFVIPAWAAVVAWRRRGLREAVTLLVACALAIAAMNGALAIAYGYDPFSALRALTSAYGAGAAKVRPYAYWVVGSPAAWAVMLGLPVIWWSLKALTQGDSAAIALWLMVAVASILGVTKAETERIWLPFVPLACAAAAAAVPAGRLRPVQLLLLVQGLAIELLFFTIW